MKKITRREFMRKSALAGTGTLTALSALSWGRVVGANGDIRVGVAGLNSKGDTHTWMLKEIPGVRVVAACDADRAVLDKRVGEYEKAGIRVKAYQDIREMFDDKEIDAVSMATPNHWHSLGTIWACQAGKDVYVEKPVSHNIWEGRKMVEAARKYKRIVQGGTQKRSMPGLQEAFSVLQSGEFGRILWARGFCYKRRESIGKVTGPQQPPETVDYNLWTGPAPLKPLTRRSLHYDWHWVWDTGNGDIGNQGIHEMDLARWALGEEGLPPRVISIGGRFGYVDDGETANTQIVFLDYEKAPLIFEVRGLPMKKDMKAMDNYRGTQIGIVVQCERGHFTGGDGGGWIHDADGRKVKQFKPGGAGDHHRIWIDAVRSRKVEVLTADIEKTHVSSALCHMGNVSHRLGMGQRPRAITRAIRDEGELGDSCARMLEHLEKNEIDLRKTKVTLGPALEFDPAKEVFTGRLAAEANALATRVYREPFVVPEDV